MDLEKEALAYHTMGRPGKIEVKPTKPMLTQKDLGLAYTPGVAVPVLKIADDPSLAYDYTAKGNLVAVVSNGTAILGLGHRGALAAKPVMEGKGVLFKRFADVDVFDIELDTTNPDEIIRTVQLMAPTFGGINLEDIKAPECFYVEETLKKTVDIPVFHDDQHGTAIISGAALLNVMELVGKDIAKIKVAVNGAGAAAIACAEFILKLGVQRENITMCDSRGVIYKGRGAGMNPYKERFAKDTTDRTLADTMKGADVFMGLSVSNVVTPEMVKSMAKDPFVLAMANPDPEIRPELAIAARPDAIVATGRSDYPNQVNNVLGFPFIFRGALDVRASAINDEMKLAAAHALADLAKQDVPDSVLKAYGKEKMQFGREYIIPSPLDPRVMLWEAPAVAKAAMETGVARRQINIDTYREELTARLGKIWTVTKSIVQKAESHPKRIVFAEGEEEKILRAASQVVLDKIGTPILLGRQAVITEKKEKLGLHEDFVIVDPMTDPKREAYAELLYGMRQRKGVTRPGATDLLHNPNYYGIVMVKAGDADTFVSGLTYDYPEVLRPALQVAGTAPDVHLVAGLYVVIVKDKIYFFTDATVNIDPTAEDLADIAILAADRGREYDLEPRIAMLSFSNFGSVRHPSAEKMRKAVEIVHQRRPDLVIDGEMQADTAVVADIVEQRYPFSHVKDANVLVFSDLEAANVAYKLLQRLGGAETIGPILMGMGLPVQILQTGDEVRDIVNMAAMAVLDAQRLA